MRVHELAKELDLNSKELVARLRALRVDVKSHMSSIDDDAVALMRKHSTPRKSIQVQPPAEDPSTPDASDAATPPLSATEKPSRPELEKSEPPTPASAEADDGKTIKLKGAIIVKDLADKLGMRPNLVIAELMKMNILAAINQKVEISAATQIAEKHGFTVDVEKRGTEHHPAPKMLQQEAEEEDRPEDLQPRPPVITFLGHVDHGKTSLLDNIRNSSVVTGESGGITQHIGAYTVDVQGTPITFLDTPGHAAFTAMRARGANLTDIAIIIVAADDGVMPQTVEAISHAKAAGVSLMVAINKMDLPAANAERVKQQLQAEDVAPEDWGGETICCEVSAQTGDGVKHLLEMILLQAEMLSLQANPDRRASGHVIEAQMEAGMGPTAHLLVTRGTLKIGDMILCGQHYGKVKALMNDHGLKVKSVGPSTPVKCLGLSGVPEAGDQFQVCRNEKLTKALASEEAQRIKLEGLVAPQKTSLEDLFSQIAENEKESLNLILRADTQGSVEAIRNSLEEIESEKISLNFILASTGNITISDVMLASASDAVIMGFHVVREPGVGPASKREGIETHLHTVIYELIDHVRDAMTGLLSPITRERITGSARLREVFAIGKLGNIAGCTVLQGPIGNKNRVRVKRNDEVLYEGVIASLKHFQEDVAEVRQGQECGVRLDRSYNYEKDDILEFYELEEVQQAL